MNADEAGHLLHPVVVLCLRFIEAAGPGVGVVRGGEPDAVVGFPFGGHAVSEFGGGWELDEEAGLVGWVGGFGGHGCCEKEAVVEIPVVYRTEALGTVDQWALARRLQRDYRSKIGWMGGGLD